MGEYASDLYFVDDSLLLSDRQANSLNCQNNECESIYHNEQELNFLPMNNDSVSLKFDEEPAIAPIQHFTPYSPKPVREKLSPMSVVRESSFTTVNDSAEVKQEKTSHTKLRGHIFKPPNTLTQRLTINSFNSIEWKSSHTKLNTKDRYFLKNNKPLFSKSRCCNCKKTNCAKLYCECLARGRLCKNCGCANCRNSGSYRDKIIDEGSFIVRKRQHLGRGEITCNCKMSGCTKKYCKCFKAGRECKASCGCEECKNKEAVQMIVYKESVMSHKKMKADK